MIKLSILSTVSQSEVERISNKKVETVEEFHEQTNLGWYKAGHKPWCKAWSGTTENEFFFIVFSHGMLTISLEEREMMIFRKPCTIAMEEKLAQSLKENCVDENSVHADLLKANYNDEHGFKDTEEITFQDVMDVLKWELAHRDVQVKKGMLFFD